jgi:transcriptional regulator with XRE-family HTH domain
MGPVSDHKSLQVNSAVELRKKAGSWLRERRCELGLSQRELARRVNMEYYTFISQIEAGRGRIPAERLQEWSEALEVEPKEFAKTLMRYYDPFTYEMLFASDRKD